MGNKRCFKCQGPGRIALDYPNRKVITLAERANVKKVLEEEEKEEDSADRLEKTQGKVVVEANVGVMLVLR